MVSRIVYIEVTQTTQIKGNARDFVFITLTLRSQAIIFIIIFSREISWSSCMLSQRKLKSERETSGHSVRNLCFFILSNQEIPGVSIMASEVKTKAMLIANANKEAYLLSATNPFLLQCCYRCICSKQRTFIICRWKYFMFISNVSKIN